MSTNSVASAPSLHPPLTSRDRLRFALFLIIPVYAQFCISPSVSSALNHISIVGTTGVCIVHLGENNVSGDNVSGDIINLGLVMDIVFGLAISCFPRLSKSYSLTAWIIPGIEGWRSTAIQWAIMLRSLIDLLPENYGSNIKVLLAYYKLAHPWFGTCVGISSFLVAWNFLDPIEDPESGHDAPVGIHEDMVAVHDALAAMLEVLAAVYEVLVVWWIVSFFVEYLYIVRLNYIHLCRYGRFKLWPDSVVVRASHKQGQLVIEEELQ